MGFWSIILGLDAACGAYLWLHWHLVFPHGAHGQPFAIALASAVALTTISIWVLCLARERSWRLWMATLDAVVAAVFVLGAWPQLDEPRTTYLLTVVLAALLTNFSLVFNGLFWLPLPDRHHASSSAGGGR
jgi:drug/metabolite transporter (DMT)-like permease